MAILAQRGYKTIPIANAQIKKGATLLGGNIGFSANSNKPEGVYTTIPILFQAA
jgi:hypothetical protein